MNEKLYMDTLKRVAADIRAKYNLRDIELADYIYVYFTDCDDSVIDRYPAYKAFWDGVDALLAVDPDADSPDDDLRGTLGIGGSRAEFAKTFGLSPNFDSEPLFREQ